MDKAESLDDSLIHILQPSSLVVLGAQETRLDY